MIKPIPAIPIVSDQDMQVISDLIEFAKENIHDIGPCDHAVNICVCGAKSTVDRASALLFRLSNGTMGEAGHDEG
jgi:hypothetical protein